MIKIDGTTFKVPIISLKRTAEFLDKYAKRTENGDLKRSLIGVYYNYELQFGDILDMSLYSSLYDKITEPKEFHEITVYSDTGVFTFTAYCSNISDNMRTQEDDINFWENLTVNFIAKTPARK